VRRLSHYLVWITSATPGSGHDTMKADTFNVHAQGLGPPDLWLADAVAHIHAKLRQMRKLVFGDNPTVVAFGRPTKPQRPGSNRSNRAESEEPVGDLADKAMAELEVNVSCEPSTSASHHQSTTPHHTRQTAHFKATTSPHHQRITTAPPRHSTPSGYPPAGTAGAQEEPAEPLQVRPNAFGDHGRNPSATRRPSQAADGSGLS
jgi:hypothetical protein